MAFPLPRGVTASEIAFLAEMETVTIVPRQRLEGLELLGVCASEQLLYLKPPKLTIARAPLKLSYRPDAPPSPSGSPSSSSVNVAQTLSHQHGYTQSH